MINKLFGPWDEYTSQYDNYYDYVEEIYED